MGKKINKGRWTADLHGEEAVVFLIGARINRLRSVRKWVPVATAMPKMLRELSMQPDLGLLSFRTYVSGRDVMVVQYWRSIEQLQAYAKASDRLHLPAWKAFNKSVKDSGIVGIWHETYRVTPGSFEAIYGNMPEHGLTAAFGGAVPVVAGSQSARARLDKTKPDEPVLTPY